MDPHYIALIPAYAAATLMWFVLFRFVKNPWEREVPIYFKRPWLEFVYAVLAVIAILAIGQLYIRGMLLPEASGNLIDALNQLIIFSPAIFLVITRKQNTSTIWLPVSNIPLRLMWGVVLAIISLFIYWIIRKDSAGFFSIISDTWHPKNISHFVQVFLEDLTIALFFVRLSAWVGRNISIALVAVLFAAGHIPALLSGGAPLNELASLLLDAGIGILILSAVSRSQDIWWFFVVHFTLDMTQFYGGPQ